MIFYLLWSLTFDIVIIFFNNYFPGHHWAKSEIPDFPLISSPELVSFISAGADMRESCKFQIYLTRMIQEGYMKDF